MNKRKAYSCSLCHEPGHNKCKCPQTTATTEPPFQTKLQQLPPEILIEIVKYNNIKSCVLLSRTSRFFYYFLTPTILPLVRHIEYPDLPDPPSHVTEAQFLTLLKGKGCQHCHGRYAPHIHTVYWEIWTRLCSVCLDEITTRDDIYIRDPLYNALPPDDVWQIFQFVPFFQKLYRRPSADDVYHKYYLKTAIPELIDTCKKALANGTYDTWKLDKKREVEESRQIAWKIEEVLEDMKNKERRKREDVRYERIDEINKRLAQYCYNMQDVRTCEAYNKAQKVSAPLTDRAWRLLKRKIEDHVITLERQRVTNPTLNHTRRMGYVFRTVTSRI